MNNQTIVLTFKGNDSVPDSDFNWFQHREAQGRVCVIANTVPGGLCVIISLNRSPYKYNMKMFFLRILEWQELA